MGLRVLTSTFKVSGSGLSVEGLGIRDKGLGCGLGFNSESHLLRRFHSRGSGTQGSGFKVEVLGCRA